MVKLQAPNQGLQVNDEPLVYIIDDVLSQEECEHIIALSEENMSRAEVAAESGNKKSNVRTGSVHWVKHDKTKQVSDIVDRVSKIVGMPQTHAESLQVIHYGKTQEYKPHFDAFDLSTDKGLIRTKKGGQRLITVLLYLNEVKQGGGTTFPKLNYVVEPKVGRAVVFHNCHKDTNTRHQNSLHGGLPVEQGEKWAFNLWYRERRLK